MSPSYWECPILSCGRIINDPDPQERARQVKEHERSHPRRTPPSGKSAPSRRGVGGFIEDAIEGIGDALIFRD